MTLQDLTFSGRSEVRVVIEHLLVLFTRLLERGVEMILWLIGHGQNSLARGLQTSEATALRQAVERTVLQNSSGVVWGCQPRHMRKLRTRFYACETRVR